MKGFKRSSVCNGTKILQEEWSRQTETKAGNTIDVTKIKCPCCGATMQVTGLENPNREEEIAPQWHHSDLLPGWESSESVSCEILEWTCPSCGAELKCQVKNMASGITKLLDVKDAY